MPKKKSSGRLVKLESAITAGLLNMETHTKLVAKALREIHDKKLYLEGVHPETGKKYTSFEAYCDGRWERHKSWGYRLINFALIAEHLSPIGDVTESQARELSGLTPDQQREALATASAGADGKPTAADVRTAAEIVAEKQARDALSEMTAEQKINRSRKAGEKARSERPAGFDASSFERSVLFHLSKARKIAEKHEEHFAAEKIQAVYDGFDVLEAAVKKLEVMRAAA